MNKSDNKIIITQLVKYVFPDIFKSHISDKKWFYYIENNVIFLVYNGDSLLLESNYIKSIEKEKKYTKITLKNFSNNFFTREFGDTISFHLYYVKEKVFNNLLNQYKDSFDDKLNFVQLQNLDMPTNELLFNLKTFFKEKFENENYEFELKMNLEDSKSLFFRLLNYLYTKNSKSYSFEKSIVNHYKNNYREITKNGKTSYEEKKLVKNHIINSFLRASLNTEKTIHSSPNKDLIKKRVRYRHSFSTSFKNIKIDLTELPLENKFEVEIEYMFNGKDFDTINIDNVEIIFKEIFCATYNTQFYYTPTVFSHFNSLKLSLTPPINIDVDTLILTKGVLLEKEFLISPKADGYTRFMGMFEGDIYLFFDETVERYSDSKKYFKNSPNLFLIGEKIENENRLDDISLNKNLFVVFDFFDKSNKNLTYEERYNKLENDYFKNNKEIIIENNNLKIILKKCYPFTFKGIKEVDTTLPFKTDGFILTSKKENIIYKIKPFNQLSIDFEVDLKNRVLLCGGNIPFKNYLFSEDKNVNFNEIDFIIREHKWISNLTFKPIIEFICDENKVLHFSRFRNSDKLYPNGTKTALSVWFEMNNDKTIFDYCDETRSIIRLRKVHNKIKEVLLNDINNYNEKINIIDIGSGMGGDLNKYQNINFDKLLLIEPDSSNLNELENRLKKLHRLKNNSKIKILNTGGEDKIAILKELNSDSNSNSNILVSMLSLTFLFNPELYPSFVSTINEIKNKKALYFFCFDKIKLLDVMEKHGIKDKKKIIINKPEKYSLIFDKNTEKVFINIDNSIVTNQTEYLVDIKKLAQDTNASKVFINSSSQFLKEHYKNAFLSEDEKILNDCYIYGKIIYDEVIDTITHKSLTFNDEEISVPKTFIDYFVVIEDFYKQKYREITVTNKKKTSPLTIKEELNEIKRHFNFNNPFYKYRHYLSKKYIENTYKDEIISNSFIVLNKAYIKMFEIISNNEKELLFSFPSLKIFCNAELPGGFLTCIQNYYYSKTEKNLENWKASSLIEGNTYLKDTYNLIEKYPQNWLMNKKFNGDISDYNNLLYIENYFLKNKVNLYTSDVGVGTEENDSDDSSQERTNWFVNLGQIKSAFDSLEECGNMIIKTYTFFEDFSQSVLGLIYNSFVKVKILKPSYSSCLNSEVYICGLGFNKKYYDKEEKELFDDYVKSSLNNKTYKVFNKKYIYGFENEIKFFFDYQIRAFKVFENILDSYTKKYFLKEFDFNTIFVKRSNEYTKLWIKENNFSNILKKDIKKKIKNNSKELIENVVDTFNIDFNISSLTFKCNLDNTFFSKDKFYSDKKVIFVYDFKGDIIGVKKEFNSILTSIILHFKNKYEHFFSLIIKFDKLKARDITENNIITQFPKIFKTLSFKVINEEDESTLYEYVF